MNKLQSDTALQLQAMQAEINKLKVTKPHPKEAVDSDKEKEKKKKKKNANKETPKHQNSGKFEILQIDPETDEDFSSGDWPDYNSDPEYQSKRRTASRKAKQSAKRKRNDHSSSDSAPGADKSQKFKENSTENTGEIKSDPNNVDNAKKDKDKKVLPPPPIKVIGIKEFAEIKCLLKEASDTEDYNLRFLGSETWRINPSNEDSYRKISEKLNEKGVQWYSHSNKNTRNIKVLCKGLPPSITEEEIVSDLLTKNFKIKSAVCLRKRIEKQQKKPEKPANTTNPPAEGSIPTPQATPSDAASETQIAKPIKEFELVKIPVHQLDFDHTESIENIFKIKAIAHTLVRMEPVKTDNKIVPQCKRCQAFSHTTNFCRKNPRCVKCAGKHLSSECMYKGRISNPKCVNCGAIGHPASYRGCPFAKDFQVARKKQLQAKKSPPDPKSFPTLGKNKTVKFVPPKKLEKSFAQALSDNISKPSAGGDNSAALISTLLQTIENLNTQLRILTEKVSKLETSQRQK